MKKLICIFALLCGTAHAEFFTGNDIQKWSDESASSNVSFGMLYGYIAGAYDAGRGTLHCSPKDVRLKQIVDMVTNHVNANPATRHFTGDVITAWVMQQTWPCAEKKKGTAL